MAKVRGGNATAFWNNAAVGAGGTSNAVELSRGTDHLAIYITVSGATTVTLEAAVSQQTSTEGVWTENAGSNGFATFIDSQNTASPVQYVFSGSGSACIRISDFVPRVVRLKSSAAVTATAGYETTGE